MLEIASQIIICLLLAALLGFMIGYILGKSTCSGNDCEETPENPHPTIESHDTQGIEAATTASVIANKDDNTGDSQEENNQEIIIDTEKVEAKESEDEELSQKDDDVKIDDKEVKSEDKGSSDDRADAKNKEENPKQEDSTDNSSNVPNTDSEPELLSAPRDGKKDNLTRIKGIGLKIEEELNKIGIYHFDQVANWNPSNIEWANSSLGFPGRADREEWVSQAKELAAGKETEFSKRVDAGEVSSSKQS